MDAIETLEERDGFTLKLYRDDDAQSPDSWDNLGVFEHSSGFSFGKPEREPGRGWSVRARSLTLFGEAVAVLPIRVDDYGSSGVRVGETDGENANGVFYVTDKRLTELCGTGAEYHTREWAEKALRGELEVWQQYFDGDVYGYVVADDKGNHVDSCWGFYGQSYAEEEGREAFEHTLTQQAEKHEQQLLGWATARLGH